MSLRDIEWDIAYGQSSDPLNRFYIPALTRSVQYDRSAGFFSSSALAIAASGIVELIRNGGTMRLLVGAQLAETDVNAIQRGTALSEIVEEKLIAALEEPEDVLMRRRLEILAWMVANQTLTIRVVVPRDPVTRLPIVNSPDYYHPKEGLFTDSEGNQLAFSGSINESVTAWRHNYEQFSVYFSWNTTRPYLEQVKTRFQRVWSDLEPNWIGVDVPSAVRNALLRYTPQHAPELDPLATPPDEFETSPVPVVVVPNTNASSLQAERIRFQFLRDAPTLFNNASLGTMTSAISPWPHQIRVSQAVINSYPRRYMLCDEVGLGKTIEAGLIVRQLVLSGMVKRCLLLVPKSVARQWQEELYEKFVLDVPLYDGRDFLNYRGEILEPAYADQNPWNRFDFFIASSQLAKREDRHHQIIEARPWDLVMVDEAHHARRKDFLQPQYRPNRLLSLLADPSFRVRSILLMTATPMQVSPIEVWDLLKVLGIGGKWGADETNFVQFYGQLRQTEFSDVNWDFVFDMVCDFLEYGGNRNTALEEKTRSAVGEVTWDKISRLLNLPCSRQPGAVVRRLPANAHPYVREIARANTPLRSLMFRNTRDLLREYVKLGILNQKVPFRHPEPIWIPLNAQERELYDRIEDYISAFYKKYEAKRTGLGFIMTIYRRRLTSSFYAVQKSLERRLAFLEGRVQSWLTDEDTEQEDLNDDVGDTSETSERDLYQEEIAYVRDFLHELRMLGGSDSKVEQLLLDLRELFRTHRTILVFTQYTDTMDYLRDMLREEHGSKVACYSGRGGELWNGIGWDTVPKEQIKQQFREGETVRILLCTEAASEGLNLQTCGVLINHDMPWNPMRVEQRIGRIDRIGQVHDVVHIRNYFYQDTIEARVYSALADRIDWFENVVGDLQPILAQVGRAIEELVMTAPAEREATFQRKLQELEQTLLDHEQQDSLNVYGTTEAAEVPTLPPSPVRLGDLERTLVTSQHVGHRFRKDESRGGSYHFEGLQITFSAEMFDALPNSVEFLSYGNPLLDNIFEQVALPAVTSSTGILRLSTQLPTQTSAYFALLNHEPIQLETFAQLEEALVVAGSTSWTDQQVDLARASFEAEVNTLFQRLSGTYRAQVRALRATVLEQSKDLLLQAALIEIVQAQGDGGRSVFQPSSFTTDAVRGLGRHGRPFRHLLNFVGEDIPIPSIQHPYYKQVAGTKSEKLRAAFITVKNKSENLLDYLNRLDRATSMEEQGPENIVSEFFSVS